MSRNNSTHSSVPVPADRERSSRTAARATVLANSLRERGQRRRARDTAKESSFVQNPRSSLATLAEVEETLRIRIRSHMDLGELEVKLTDNCYTMLSVKRDSNDGKFKLRLHRMFTDASTEITRALALYVEKNDTASSRRLGEYIDANQHLVKAKSSEQKTDTEGEVHDLASIFDSLNKTYFGGSIGATITWGQRCGKARKRNSIKMGSYAMEDQCIRVHRSLDQAYVPRFFIEWIVYHEMLHEVHQAPLVNGRRQFHTKAFLRDEAKFQHYDLARCWERDHLEQLLTY